MERPATRRLLVFLSLLTLWSIAAVLASLGTAKAPAPARVGVGGRNLTCNTVALDEFYLKHVSCTNWAEPRARDSRIEAVTAAHHDRHRSELVKGQFYLDVLAPSSKYGLCVAIRMDV